MDTEFDFEIRRNTFTQESTIGEFWMDGGFVCYTLEDTVRNIKLPDQTCIPSGTYEMYVDYSNHFGRKMPHLRNVPGYTEIMIHWGNNAEDTDGCVLVGNSKGHDFIGESRLAFDSIWPRIKSKCDAGKVYVKITGGLSAEEMAA